MTSAQGEAFSYDLADQAMAFQLNVANPQNVSQPLPRNIVYDPNGNRTSFQAVQYGATNNLSQYTTRTGGTTADYDSKGNMTIGLDGSTYTYDAQNRLLSATKNGVSMSFEYDGLNRQVSRTLSSPNTRTYSTWDGWNLVEEYTNNPLVIQARYLYGPTGVIKELQNNRYYCQDGSGSTALLADSTGHLLEWYRYDLQGTPFFYYPNDTQRSPNQSGFGVRHLFTGQQWYGEVGLYDLRNRFYSPDLGRFLQPDPIGFRGGKNLYGYCGNNPVTRWDLFGLQVSVNTKSDGSGAAVWHEAIVITGSEVPLPQLGGGPPPDLGSIAPSPFGGSLPTSGGGPGGTGSRTAGRRATASSNNRSNTPAEVPPQNPPSVVPPGSSAPPTGTFSHWDAASPIIIGPVNMRLDDDGSGPNHQDKHHDKYVSYYWFYGRNLNADTVPYIVAPMSALQQGVKAGDVAFAIGNGTWVRSFVGDFGGSDNGWGEVSLATAWSMGVPTVDMPYPVGPVIPQSYGPVPITIIVIPTGY